MVIDMRTINVNEINITCFGSDGPELGVTFPEVTGVTDGKACHTTQTVTVSDNNLNTVTLNCERQQMLSS